MTARDSIFIAVLLCAAFTQARADEASLLRADAPDAVAIAPGPAGGTLIAIADEEHGGIVLRENNDGGPIVATIADEQEALHVCFARDIHDGSLYLFSGGEHGRLTQHQVFTDAAQHIATRRVRTLSIGGETTSCVADDVKGIVYVAEPDVGLWRVETDPETDAVREPAAMVEPFGSLKKPMAVALVSFDGELRPLVADEDTGTLRRLGDDGKVSAEIALELDGGSMTGLVIGDDMAAVAIEVEGAEGDSENRVDLVPLGTIGTPPAAKEIAGDAIVHALAETDPVSSGGDAADDPAIWVHPADSALSLVLGTNKQAGLAVYDLAGRQVQFLPDGKINNVDLRPGFGKPGTPDFIAAASDRTNAAIALYGIDTATRHVTRVDAHPIPAGFAPYGLCMYRNARSGKLYVFATSEDGRVRQWRLGAARDGRVDAKPVRTITVGTVAEGCVADDEHGYLYVAEEDVGIWRYGAEPGAGDRRTAVARVKPDGELTDDVEGLAIYPRGDGGFLVASSQGSNSYAVYDRLPPHTFRGLFRVRADAVSGIDGASETDGLDVASAALPGFPDGLLVVQDGRNVEPEAAQNFKFVSWRDVAAALDLPAPAR